MKIINFHNGFKTNMIDSIGILIPQQLLSFRGLICLPNNTTAQWSQLERESIRLHQTL